MELELVSIKDSSQGCRVNGQQEGWYRLIIQIGYDYHRAESLGQASVATLIRKKRILVGVMIVCHDDVKLNVWWCCSFL